MAHNGRFWLKRAIKFNQFIRTARNVLTTVSVIQILVWGHFIHIPIIGCPEIIGILTVILRPPFIRYQSINTSPKEVSSSEEKPYCGSLVHSMMTNDSRVLFNQSHLSGPLIAEQVNWLIRSTRTDKSTRRPDPLLMLMKADSSGQHIWNSILSHSPNQMFLFKKGWSNKSAKNLELYVVQESIALSCFQLIISISFGVQWMNIDLVVFADPVYFRMVSALVAAECVCRQ